MREQVEQKARVVEHTDSAGDTIYQVKCNETNEQLAMFRDKARAEEYLRCRNTDESFMARALADANNRKKSELKV